MQAKKVWERLTTFEPFPLRHDVEQYPCRATRGSLHCLRSLSRLAAPPAVGARRLLDADATCQGKTGINRPRRRRFAGLRSAECSITMHRGATPAQPNDARSEDGKEERGGVRGARIAHERSWRLRPLSASSAKSWGKARQFLFSRWPEDALAVEPVPPSALLVVRLSVRSDPRRSSLEDPARGG